VNWADEFSAPTGSLQRATDPALGDDGEYPTLDQPSNVAVVSHAFSHGYHPRHTERLAAYWAESLSGPKRYSDIYGDETSVVRIHSGNGPHEEMDRRAIVCFDQALEDVGSSATIRCDSYCTTTSSGLPLPRCRATTTRQTTSRKVFASHTGRGTDLSAEPGPTNSEGGAAGST